MPLPGYGFTHYLLLLQQPFQYMSRIHEHVHLSSDRLKYCFVQLGFPLNLAYAAVLAMFGIGRTVEGEIHFVLFRAEAPMKLHPCTAVRADELFAVDVLSLREIVVFPVACLGGF